MYVCNTNAFNLASCQTLIENAGHTFLFPLTQSIHFSPGTWMMGSLLGQNR